MGVVMVIITATVVAPLAYWLPAVAGHRAECLRGLEYPVLTAPRWEGTLITPASWWRSGSTDV